MNACEFLFETLAIHDGSPYGKEPVSQFDHALQCAALAVAAGADTPLIVAALLHDVGHLIQGDRDGVTRRGSVDRVDDRHEILGGAILSRWFEREVTEPIRLHVLAKRYLCAIDPDYYDSLSAGSQRSLELQGGVFDGVAAGKFAALPFAEDAVKLRRWDDLAKIPNLDVPGLEFYRGFVEQTIVRVDQAEKIAV